MFRFKPMAGFMLAAGLLAVTSTAASYGSTARPSQTAAARPAQHVLLISVDGLHQSDLRWWIRHHPCSVLARIAHAGTQYTNAATPIPSDSFPGLVAQVTGGDPRIAHNPPPARPRPARPAGGEAAGHAGAATPVAPRTQVPGPVGAARAPTIPA